MNTLKDRVTEAMKAAMKAKDADRLSTIRMLLAACKQKEVDERVVLDDAAVVAIVDRLIKQRRDSVAAFRQGGRDDLVAKESAEIAVLETFLPRRMSEAEVAEVTQSLITELGAKGLADLGKVIAAAKNRLAGQAEMGVVSAVVKKQLSS